MPKNKARHYLAKHVSYTRRFGATLGCLAVLLLTACGSNDTNDTFPPLTGVPDLSPGRWHAIDTGGDSMCADGSAYRFYVYPGRVNKLTIGFQGGGACWNDATCPYSNSRPNPDNGQSFYVDAVHVDELGLEPNAPVQGVFDQNNPANPFRDWFQVYVPYCTADIHLGNSSESYQDSDGNAITVHHRGAVNTREVLEWVYQAFENPQQIFVSGGSAGAYGALMWFPDVRDAYPQASVHHLSDCGAGIISESFAQQGLSRWNVAASFPELAGELNADIIIDAYSSIAARYPQSVLSQHNTVLDGTQIAFYVAMQNLVNPDISQIVRLSQAWSEGLQQSLRSIRSTAPNFSYYTSTFDEDGNPLTGTAHCMLQRDELYSWQDQEQPLLAWLNRVIAGDVPEPVAGMLPQSAPSLQQLPRLAP